MSFTMRTPAMLMAGLSVLAAGCAGASRDQLREAYDVQTITIDRNVGMPKDIHYVSVGQRWAGVAAGIAGGLGAVAGAALVGGVSSTAVQTAAISASSGAKVKGGADDSVPRYFTANDIDVGRMFAHEMQEALEHNQFAVSEGGRANHLRLSVVDYGFHSTEMFGRDMRLVMKVKAELFSPGGHKLWTEDSSVGSNHVDLPERSFEQYLSNPARLAEDFRRICADMADRLQRDLRQSHPQLVTTGHSTYASRPTRAAPGTRAIEPMPASYVVDSAAPSAATAPTVMDDAPPPPVVAQAPIEQMTTSTNSGGTRHRARTISPSPTAQAPAPVATQPAVEPATAPASQGTLARAGAAVRKRPVHDSQVLATLSASTNVDTSTLLQNDEGAWFYVTTPTVNGWIAASDLDAR